MTTDRNRKMAEIKTCKTCMSVIHVELWLLLITVNHQHMWVQKNTHSDDVQ